MQVEKSTTTKLYVTDVSNLDPVTIYLEDNPPHRGKITIECYGKAWSYYWGNIGAKSIMDFFVNCDNHYLSEKFDPHTPRTITDEDTLEKHAKQHILENRKTDYISRTEARDLWDLTDGLCADDNYALSRIYGDEWWDCLPQIPNHKIQYLYRILDVCKEAVRLYYSGLLGLDKQREKT